MIGGLHPLIGKWYENVVTQDVMQVIDIDHENGVVDVQHFDGTIEGLGMDEWYSLDLELAEPPEDIEGAFDTMQELEGE
ncbi:MAG: hypothetical protein M0022_08540 [Desulfobacteraceae bacterium]|nr:hypothetical protein [Desulfobacteraceae bacterium]